MDAIKRSLFVLALASLLCQHACMSVADNFRAFRANYLIPAATVGTISYRYKRITKQLNKDFWSTESETSHSRKRCSQPTAVQGMSSPTRLAG